MTYCYRITMRTPMGEKHGRLTLVVAGDEISGVFSILQRQNPVTGQLGAGGTCRLTGQLTTLTRTLAFEATGTLQPNALALTLQAGARCYPVTGAPADPT